MPAAPYAVYVLNQSGRYRCTPWDLDDGKPGVDLDAAHARLAALLAEAGVRHVVVASRGQGPRRHVLATWSGEGLDPVEVAALARALKRCGVAGLDPVPLAGGRTAAIRPPLSPHRSGSRAVIVGDQEQALSDLQDGNGPEAWRRLCELAGVTASDLAAAARRRGQTSAADHRGAGSRPWRPLPARWEQAWREGTTAPAARDYEGTGRSQLLNALAIVCVTYGWTFSEFARRCRDPRFAGGDRARRRHAPHCRCSGGDHDFITRSTRERDAEIASIWEDAQEFLADNPPVFNPAEDDQPDRHLVDETLSRLWAALYATRWPGRDGIHDRQLLAYLLMLALLTGRLELGGSCRLWAVAAGLTKSTVARALDRLQAAGFLRLTQAASGPLGAVYELTIPQNHTAVSPPANGTLALHPPAPALHTLPDLVNLRRHDVWDWTGLGSTAAAVFTELGEDGRTVAEVAAGIGISRASVHSKVRTLARYGLIVRRSGRWHRVEHADLDQVADRLGSCGARARRAARYELDRLTWRWYLQDFEARRGWAVQRGHYHPEQAALPLERGGQPPPGYPHRHSFGRTVPSWTDARQYLADQLREAAMPRTIVSAA